jgi:TnsA endonuclease N terminal/TnsA endonuclease C terminal
MPRRKYRFTKATHTRRLKEGRGQGDGALYRPYIYVQDFSSRGQSNRDFGSTAGRQHDLLSKVEHRVFLVFEESDLYDIKEQFPHPLELSIAIARQCGLRHPAHPQSKELVPVTTDFLLKIPLPVGSKYVARSVKRFVDLAKPGIIEKLELDRRCCQRLTSDWGIITERDINYILVQNLLLTYKFRDVNALYPLSQKEVRATSEILTNVLLAKDIPLCDTAFFCDQLLGLPNGTCLRLARHLIASRQWIVDLSSVLIVPTERLTLRYVALSTD